MNDTPFISKDELDSDSSGCRIAEPFLHLYVEGELDPIRSQLLSAHLESCAACRSARRELERERLWLMESTVSAPPLSEHFREKVLARIRKEKAEAVERRRSDIFFRATGAAAAVLILAYAAFHSLEEPRRFPEADHETAKVVFPHATGAAGPASSSSGARFVSLPLAEAQDAWVESMDCIDDEAPEDEPGVDPETEGPSGEAGESPRRFKIADVAQMAAELEASLPRRLSIEENDPCRPDPNRDGKAGWDDVAILCQAILRGSHEHFLDGGHESALVGDCRDVCIRMLEQRVEFGS